MRERRQRAHEPGSRLGRTSGCLRLVEEQIDTGPADHIAVDADAAVADHRLGGDRAGPVARLRSARPHRPSRKMAADKAGNPRRHRGGIIRLPVD